MVFPRLQIHVPSLIPLLRSDNKSLDVMKIRSKKSKSKEEVPRQDDIDLVHHLPLGRIPSNPGGSSLLWPSHGASSHDLALLPHVALSFSWWSGLVIFWLSQTRVVFPLVL